MAESGYRQSAHQSRIRQGEADPIDWHDVGRVREEGAAGACERYRRLHRRNRNSRKDGLSLFLPRSFDEAKSEHFRNLTKSDLMFELPISAGQQGWRIDSIQSASDLALLHKRAFRRAPRGNRAEKSGFR